MTRVCVGTIAAVILTLIAFAPTSALDPPHDETNDIICTSCHTPHNAPGGTITRVAGNSNLCQSCHNPTGPAAAKAIADSDQAFPGIVGTSHRFDSGPAGHVQPDPANTSTGTILSGGAFEGRVERTISILIVVGGNAGVAVFEWFADDGGTGGGVAGGDVPLVNGLTLTFRDGPDAPSFITGDTWTLFVRTDLRAPDPSDPLERSLALRARDGKVVCSTCHDQHSQRNTPADPLAPEFDGPGTGEGRHYQRVDNDANQMCHICHSARDVDSPELGSHPVGVPIPDDSTFQHPASLDLVGERVDCTTCHSPHFTDSGGAQGGAGDGYLLDASIGELCYQCHTLADRDSASHLNELSGTLWPGGQYGSTFPAHTPEKRGFCVNCHWPHGWPDDAAMERDYPRLWVERYDVDDVGGDPDDAEDLCFTCHDGEPARSNVRGEFSKGENAAVIFHHPVVDSEQSPGRSVECVDCHDPHRATSDDKHKGIDGIALDGSPVGPGTENPVDIVEYELCFKCHGDTFNASRPGTTNKRLDFQPTNSAFHPVAGPGRNRSENLARQLLGGLTPESTINCTDCHNSDETADVEGPASGSAHATKGPHGSANATILRGEYLATLLGPADFNRNNFEVCFLCHDVSRLVRARRWDDGAATNFYDDVDGEDNLHWLHLVDEADDARATCKNCHFNVHSNRSAPNTQYNIDGTLFDAPPPSVHTHLVNFSPDIQPFGGRAKPEWWLDTSTRVRRCYLVCHGEAMEGFPYRPSRGDDDPLSP